MIKELITDLANDKILLSQALLRSKIIATKINNAIFKSWIKKESEGYNFDDDILPGYRKVFSEMNLIAQFPGGEEKKIPFKLPESTSQEIIDTIYLQQILEPILIVEIQLTYDDKPIGGKITLPSNIMEIIKSTLPKVTLLQINYVGGVIEKLERNISIINYHNIINQTKHKLLEILLELENEFPNLENDYIMNDENKNKTDSIITTNIYGSNSPVNIATGNNNVQSNNISIASIDFEKLRSLNVEEKDIQQLQTLVTESGGDKSKVASKVFAWLSSVTSSLVARGLYDNIPQITEFVQTLV